MALCSSLLWGEGRVPFKSFLRVQIKQVSMYMPAVHKLNAIDVIIKSDNMFIMAIRVVEFSNGGYKIRKIFA